ncbi:MAG TPA: HEAT repeat domain-containing protein [Desulfuromonadales bacterium]|nr:HEAT repeat domain-containing protein [Desulfuromonadales bacterium]
MADKARARINALQPLLKDPAPEVRLAAADAIEALEASSTVVEILETLKNGNMGARIGAIYALGEVGGAGVLKPLVYCARRPEIDIRSAAVAALGKLALAETLPVLVELLDDESPIVQACTVAALRNFSATPEILIKLRPLLDAHDGVLEAETALTLSRFKDTSSLPRIEALLTSPHASTRQAAAIAFSKIPFQ